MATALPICGVNVGGFSSPPLPPLLLPLKHLKPTSSLSSSMKFQHNHQQQQLVMRRSQRENWTRMASSKADSEYEISEEGETKMAAAASTTSSKSGGGASLADLVWKILNPQQIVLMVVVRDEDGLVKEKFDHLITKDRQKRNGDCDGRPGWLMTMLGSLFHWVSSHIMYLLFSQVRDEDGRMKATFDRVISEHSKEKNYKCSLDEFLDCLLENADRIISSGSLVSSIDMQLHFKVSKLEKHTECFKEKKFAEDDTTFTQMVFCIATYDDDEFGDVNVHTIQDFKAFLQKLRSIESDKLMIARPFKSWKVYLNRILDSSKSYSHLSA